MKQYQHQFIELSLSNQVLQFGEFVLKSGRKSPYFFNTELFNIGKHLALLGHICAKALIDSKIDFNLLFGLAYKGIPIAITTSIALSEHYKRDNIAYCFNRKEEKKYGEGGNLVGSMPKGRIIIVDDVITAGTAVRESMKIIQDNATLAGVFVLFDRQERGDSEISAIIEIERDYNCPVISMIKLEDLVEYLEERPKMANYLSSILQYQKIFGASLK